MKTNNQIRRIVHDLVASSCDIEKKLDEKKVRGIISLLQEEEFYTAVLKIEKSERIKVLKAYVHSISRKLVEQKIQVTTAYDLDDMEKAKYKSYLLVKLKKDQISFNREKDIIAGIRIHNGWDIIDSSIKYTIDTLR